MWCFLHPLLSFIVFLHHHSCFLHRTTINLWLFPTMASFQHVGYSITPCHHSYPELLSSGFVHFTQCISVAVWWLKVQLLFAAPPLFISGSSQIQQSERQGIVRSSCCLWWGLLDFILIFNFFFDCGFFVLHFPRCPLIMILFALALLFVVSCLSFCLGLFCLMMVWICLFFDHSHFQSLFSFCLSLFWLLFLRLCLHCDRCFLSSASIVFDQFCLAPCHFEIWCLLIFSRASSFLLPALLLSSYLERRLSNRGPSTLLTLVFALLCLGVFVFIVVVWFHFQSCDAKQAGIRSSVSLARLICLFMQRHHGAAFCHLTAWDPSDLLVYLASNIHIHVVRYLDITCLTHPFNSMVQVTHFLFFVSHNIYFHEFLHRRSIHTAGKYYT